MKESRLTTIARRGLLLPAETLEQVRKTGIRCRPQLDVVYQQQAKTWKLRGEESGGAVELLGHYVGFVDVDGGPLPWLQRIQNFLPNGMHAVIVGDEFVRVEMLRFQNTYDLLITKHRLEHRDGQRAQMRNTILFASRNGFLETELWGKDAAFRGGAMPHFLTRSGEPGPPDSLWTDATLKATEAVCCCGCRHSHLLEATRAPKLVEVSA
ncbi:MAG TPA: hypothetical protein VGI45_07200 [Terracidiphilus sp.]|jgi:hypothetical protein